MGARKKAAEGDSMGLEAIEKYRMDEMEALAFRLVIAFPAHRACWTPPRDCAQDWCWKQCSTWIIAKCSRQAAG